jgi:ADP-heptose:LPS heptosyltransferase
LTQAFLSPLFTTLPRTEVYPVDKKGRHKGMAGLWKLVGELTAKEKYDAVADLHNVLRSTIIRLLFKFRGTRTAMIDKGRTEKKQLTRKENKKLVPLKSSFQRYADVFNELDLPLALNPARPVFNKRPLPFAARELFIPGKKAICIAPFAKHREKTYPAEHMKTVIRRLAAVEPLQVFLLGGGSGEQELLSAWTKEIQGVTNLAGKFSFEEELAIISNFEVMISMDSANMHLASLFGVPVISVWGATHPFAGFYGWGQDSDNAVQIDLYCRPCSVFGNKPCYRGDHACMVNLSPDLVVQQLNKLLPGKP